jgi:hypothetical protein
MIYHVYISRVQGEPRSFVPVEGSAVRIDGAPDVRLFVHRCPVMGDWKVSEVTTGSYIGSPHQTERKAVEAAKSLILHNGVKRLRAAVAKSIKQMPCAPDPSPIAQKASDQ